LVNGLIILGTVFGVLDGPGLLPQLPAATVANAPAASGHQGVKKGRGHRTSDGMAQWRHRLGTK
jgi:hypothetical protein